MNMPIIELSHVYKAYRTAEIETWALADVSLSIGASQFVAVTGPSGCGKSTLMNVVGLLDQPDRGEVSILGHEIGRGDERRLTSLRRGRIGFIFQNFNLIDELSVSENVAMPLTYLHLPRAERRARTEAVLHQVGLTHRKSHRPSQLSGGQQQRVAIARALVSEPRIILADEPTGNLDSENSRTVIDMLQTLTRGGTAVVMVTHAPELADMADRRIVMRDGRIVDEFQAAA